MRILFVLTFMAALTFGCNSNKKSINKSTERSSSSSERRGGDRNEKKGPPSADEIFKMDANNDGLLSKSEIDGPLAKDFDRIDSNNDGYITREEFKNAPKPQRGQRPQRNN